MKINVTNRLYIGFAVAIVLVLLVGLMSYLIFRKQHTDAATIKETYDVLNRLETMQRIMIDMETGRRGFRSTNELRFLEPYYKGLSVIRPQLQEFKTRAAYNNHRTLPIDELETAIEDLLGFWATLPTDASRYTREDILKIMWNEKQRMDRVRHIFDRIEQTESRHLSDKIEQNRRSVTDAVILLIVGIVLILLVVIALIRMILIALHDRRKAGYELQKSNRSLTNVNRETENKNWVLAGLARVNNSLHNATNTTELSKSLLDTLIDYLQVNAGAIYLYDETRETLNVAATYATPADFKTSFKLNEGLVGAAALKKEASIVAGLTRNEIVFDSAAVNATPGVACYMPLYLDQHLKAVIELFSFQEFDKRKLELLNVIANNIAVAMDSLDSNQKVIELLKQVQEQKEVLENQQEELRQTNEELSLQAEVLQASEEELRVQEEELRQINAELEEKNQAVESARVAVSMKAKELEAASKYKSEFLANMSHELRTPLNSVLILARLLADDKQQNLTEKQRAHAKIIYKSGSDLLELINDILDLSKIEAGKVEVTLEEVQIATITKNLQQLFTVVADEKGIELKVEPDEGVPAVIKTDQQKVEQVLKNLLSNAFKFTGKDGTVTLRTSFSGNNEIVFSVTDTGVGIPESKQKVIFEAFQQADMSTSRRFGGTGLGLSITKELVRLLKGRVELESVEGQGSTFRIHIPVNSQVDAKEPAAPKPKELKIEEVLAGSATQQEIIKDDRHSIEGNEKVMLIIEDDIFFATIIKDFAQEKGFKTIVALNGKEGLFCAKKFRPTVITLDLNLPEIDGWELLRTFKNDKDLKHIPVHVISAADGEKQEGMGALAYLQKPIKENDLENAFAVIGEHLNFSVKKVMLYAVAETSLELQALIKRKPFDVQFEEVTKQEEAFEKFKTDQYDCLIVDIGIDIERGIAVLRRLHQELHPQKIPTIIYLDKDISAQNEIEIKKLAQAVVRKSATSNNRMIEELELFMYKVQQEKQQQNKDYLPVVSSYNSLQNKTILVVDDDMRNVFALSAILEQEQMTIVTASDGKEAIQALKDNPGINLVLMDVMMPEMDGYQAMRIIRNEMLLTKLPIIALTAKAMVGDREKCLEAGASDYVTKPVDNQKLISLLQLWLS